MSRRWIRLDVGCFESEWLVGLEPLAQHAWTRLLLYVKISGKLGRAKVLGPAAVEKLWGIPSPARLAMLEAAHEDGALHTVDGDWVVTGWEKYQEPDRTRAERQANWRERHRKEVTDVTPLPAVSTPSPVTRPLTTDIPTEELPLRQPREEVGHSGVRGGLALAAWLGSDGGPSIDRFIAAHPENAKAVDSIRATYGQESLAGSKVWGKVPPAERPAILLDAIESYAGEGKQYRADLFRRFVETRAHPRSSHVGGRGAHSPHNPGSTASVGGEAPRARLAAGQGIHVVE